MTLNDLVSAGFDIHALNHAQAVLERDFPKPMSELCDIMLDFTIPVEELVRRGGGEAPFTQRLRRSFESIGWPKQEITIGKTIDGEERESTTHIIDHVRSSEAGLVALEIEWNNKDPFYDRDLENFQRLHREGAISVGVIITTWIISAVCSTPDRIGLRPSPANHELRRPHIVWLHANSAPAKPSRKTALRP